MISIVALIFADIWSHPAADLLHLAAYASGIWGIGLYWFAGLIYARQGFRLLEEGVHEPAV